MSAEEPVSGRAGDGGRGTRLFWSTYAAAWAVFVFGYFVMVLLRSDRSVLRAAEPAVTFTVPAALLGVGVVHMARRWNWPPERPVRFSLLHLASAAVYSLAWGASLSLGFGVQRILAGRPFDMPSFDNTLIALHLLFGLVVYGAIAGGTYLDRVGRRLRAERERAARAEALRARAQFRALRARLKPHFLFNSLHSVLSLIRRAPDRAERAVEHLGELLRYAVGSGPVADGGASGPEQVTLGRELEMVRTYLELEKIRLGDRLRVEEEVTPDAAAVHVPPLSVQPLVENAVQHGIGESPDGGTVRLTARVEAEGAEASSPRLSVRVRDDGPGADPESLDSSGGIGLELVRRRLQLAYGRDAELRLETEPGEGFEARVTVPTGDGGTVLAGGREET